MGIKLIKKTNESFESDLENIAQTSGEIEYDDAWKLNRSAAKDPELRKKVRNLIGDWRSAAEDEDNDEMTKAAKALKALADSLPKQEARMHLGRCKNCGSGWTKTNYVDELEPDVRKYFKEKGFADNADICPKCVAAVKKHLAQGKSEGATYDEYVDAVAASLEDDFEYSPVTALEFARDDFKDITKACYSATKDPKEAAKEIDAKYMGGNEGRKKAEGHNGWEDWEEIEGLESSIDGIEKLAYELRHCIRGAYTHCKDWKSLALYIKGLASNLDDAAELMAYKRDDEDDESANESEEPVGELFDALKQALAGKGYKVSQFTSDKEFVGQEKPYDGISIENEDPNAYHKNPYRIVLDTDANLFRIFFPHVRRKSVTGQPGSISGIVKFILRDLNLDESKKKKNPSKDFSSTVEEDEDGKKKSH